MTTASMEWDRHVWSGAAADFHAMELPSTRAMWWCQVEAPSLILGSTQSDDDVDLSVATGLGVAVARRRSGGAAVFVDPTDSVWIDVTISRHDPLWNDDVVQSMLWLGDCLVGALSPWVHSDVYRKGFDIGTDGRVVCFASSSPGEVFVGPNKVVGISQRRHREGARFQCVLYRHWQPSQWVSVLADSDVRDRVTGLEVATVDAAPVDIVESIYQGLKSLAGGE